ncbi:MAG: amidohydrolase [Chloroflexi bacterium]|nr:amidohydrolase [Chloroflexota bacterium]
MVRADAVSRIGQGKPDFEQIKTICGDPARLIDYMDERNIWRMVLINYVSPEVMGFTEETNDFSARFAGHRPERFIPFGGIDPRRVKDVAAEMDRLLGDLRLRGIKIHPPHQLLRANGYLDDPDLRGLATVYEKCIAYNIPVMVHTGTSIFPRARNKYGDPMDLDDVAMDFPDLKLIVAHGGRPLWMETVRFLLRRHPNLFFDVSSVPPSRLLNYFPWLEHVADRALFGSDWPAPLVLDIGKNVEQFMQVPLPDEAKRKILHDNAQALFA